MKQHTRYKPTGWRNEPHRHALAAKGIKTNRNYLYRKMTPVDNVIVSTVPTNIGVSGEGHETTIFDEDPSKMTDELPRSVIAEVSFGDEDAAITHAKTVRRLRDLDGEFEAEGIILRRLDDGRVEFFDAEDGTRRERTTIQDAKDAMKSLNDQMNKWQNSEEEETQDD